MSESLPVGLVRLEREFRRITGMTVPTGQIGPVAAEWTLANILEIVRGWSPSGGGGGAPSGPAGGSLSGTYPNPGLAGSVTALFPTADEKAALDAAAAPDGANPFATLADLAAGVPDPLHLDNYLEIGAAPAQDGVIRLENGMAIKGRNQANDADKVLIGIDVDFGGVIDVDFDGIGTHFGNFIALGVNLTPEGPAETGMIRLPYGEGIYVRNAANNGDVNLLSLVEIPVPLTLEGADGLTLILADADPGGIVLTYPDGIDVTLGGPDRVGAAFYNNDTTGDWDYLQLRFSAAASGSSRDYGTFEFQCSGLEDGASWFGFNFDGPSYTNNDTFRLHSSGTLEAPELNLNALPAADPAIAGQVWNNSGVLMVSAG